MGLYEYGIYEVIKRNARVNGGRTALIGGGQQITYSQLLENVDRLACGLLQTVLRRRSNRHYGAEQP
jgi:non-ribosomal peptide synthetase component E (peptide arylation enzyme)